ncbi:DUF342 domain-containing protein [Calidifontibacillus oryziterrae]|uniref:DUF342 domain-containing protein n=1 Tax=Calidifontibacillus oryziterrae TaxID=1191699 RepID=UPI0002F2EE78|nr:FapA family protein [Calidifontibacillus oryziterrae]
MAMEIFSNEFFQLEEENEFIYITVKKPGFLIKEFNDLLEKLPRIEINQFMNLRMALEEASGAKIHIGSLRPVVQITISKDKMEAKAKINESDHKFFENMGAYTSKVVEALKQNNITDGILTEVIKNELIPRREIVIAKGIPPIDGEPAKVKYYQLSERKPAIREDGKADYYDMNFIDEVKKGTWLGEKIERTEGTPGRTVTGESLKQKKGKDRRLLYDKKTVEAVNEDGKTILRAKIDGVVKFIEGKISVGNHLVIDGDVGVETGNIDFDGSVEIKGTVQPGFSVTATGDISILSELGINGAKLIQSRNGDVFVKGGIFGQGKSQVIAAKNIYIKHANECFLEAEEDINIGYYSIGSSLKGKNVITDDRKGKVIGGVIEAKGKVVAAYIGNKMERKTVVNVAGFDRNAIKKQLDELLIHYKKVVTEVEQLKRQLEIFESFLKQLDENQLSDYKQRVQKYEELMSEVSNIEIGRKALMDYLETKGEGQVLISQEAFPEVLLEIKHHKKKLNHPVRGTFYALGKELHFE